MNTSLHRRADSADIALVLEGTFPYVRGGVSSWINQIIRAFPEHTFAIVFIGSRLEDYEAPAYELPDNVWHFEEHFLYDFVASEMVESSAGDPKAFEHVEKMHEALRQNKKSSAIGGLMREMMPMLAQGAQISEKEFLHSRCSWDFITDHYERFC